MTDLAENWADEDAATVGHLLVPAAQNLLTALVIKPDSADVKEGLATVESKDFRLLTTILTSTLMGLSPPEIKRLKPYCAQVASKIVDQVRCKRHGPAGQRRLSMCRLRYVPQGRAAMEGTDVRLAMKLFQTAMQIDEDNTDAVELFEEAESTELGDQAQAESNVPNQHSNACSGGTMSWRVVTLRGDSLVGPSGLPGGRRPGPSRPR